MGHIRKIVYLRDKLSQFTYILLHYTPGGEVVGLQVPMMAARFTGTGDLFTSLYLAWSEQGVKVCVVVWLQLLRVQCRVVYM